MSQLLCNRSCQWESHSSSLPLVPLRRMRVIYGRVRRALQIQPHPCLDAMDKRHVNQLSWAHCSCCGVQFFLDASGATRRFGRCVHRYYLWCVSVKTVHTFVVLGLLGLQYTVNVLPDAADFYPFLLTLSVGFFTYTT